MFASPLRLALHALTRPNVEVMPAPVATPAKIQAPPGGTAKRKRAQVVIDSDDEEEVTHSSLHQLLLRLKLVLQWPTQSPGASSVSGVTALQACKSDLCCALLCHGPLSDVNPMLQWAFWA